jgi:hypothetical protein
MFDSFIRKAIAVSVLSLPIVALTAHTALADKANFSIENNSDVAISELYLSDSSLENWNNDILGQGILDSGERITVDFADPSPDRCMYDIKAIFADGQEVEDYRINVCTNEQYQFFNQ